MSNSEPSPEINQPELPHGVERLHRRFAGAGADHPGAAGDDRVTGATPKATARADRAVRGRTESAKEAERETETECQSTIAKCPS